MINLKLKNLGIAAVTTLSLYGAGNVVSNIYHYFKPEQTNNETYRLSLIYCNPERCIDNTTPGLINLTRVSDGRSLWSANIETYPSSRRPYVARTWTDPELSDKLGKEITLDIIGSP